MRRKQTQTGDYEMVKDERAVNERLSDPEAAVVIIIQMWNPAKTINAAKNIYQYVLLLHRPPLYRSQNISTCADATTLCAPHYLTWL